MSITKEWRQAVAMIPPNSVRLVHIQRRSSSSLPCGHCEKSLEGLPTFWRVRAFVCEDPKKGGNHFVGTFCSEACARELYDEYRVEIALITGKKPETRRTTTGGVDAT